MALMFGRGIVVECLDDLFTSKVASSQRLSSSSNVWSTCDRDFDCSGAGKSDQKGNFTFFGGMIAIASF